ncbi:hypothetical protein ABKA04_001839 [Annulohypoxylon sp. FPYF3050]
MASTDQTAAPVAGATTLPPRKFKASDLPLTSATRSAIEGLAHSFKKKGGYDAIRKQVWEKFEQSDYEVQVTKSIVEVAEQELERNPAQLLSLDRRKAATLIDGALDRSGVYQKADELLDQLIDVDAIEKRMRELREAEIGVEAAREEQARGSKTDAEYAAESSRSLDERDRIRRELRAKEEQILEEKRKIEREERKKRERERERELEKAEAKRKEERDARRREREKKEAEREREREKEREERRKARERDREKDQERETRRRSRSRSRHISRDRSRHRDRDRDRDRNRDRSRSRRRDSRERRHRDRSTKDDRDRGKPEELKKQLTKEDHERLEKEALEDLLRESKKSTAKQPELEIDEALVPPPRRTKPASAIQPIRRESMKSSDLKKTSEPAKSEAKDVVMKDAKEVKEVKESKESKDTKDSKPSKESKPSKPTAEPKEKEAKSSKDTKEVKAKDDRRPNIAIVIATVFESAVALALGLTEENVADRDTDRLAETAVVPVIASGLQKEIGTSTGPGREIGLALVAVLIVIERREAVHGIDINPSTESEADLRGVERTETNKTGPAHTLALNAGMIVVTIDAMIDGTDPVHQSLEPREFARAKHEVTDAEAWKQGEIKKREQEAKAYLAAQREAREKGLPVPGVDDKWNQSTAIEIEPINTESGIGMTVETKMAAETGTTDESVDAVGVEARVVVEIVTEVVTRIGAKIANVAGPAIGTAGKELETAIGIMTATGIAIVIDIAKETASQTVTKIVTETRIGEAVATGASTHEETETETETEGTEALNHAGTGEIEVRTLEEIAGTEVAVAVDGAIVSCAGTHFIG